MWGIGILWEHVGFIQDDLHIWIRQPKPTTILRERLKEKQFFIAKSYD